MFWTNSFLSELIVNRILIVSILLSIKLLLFEGRSSHLYTQLMQFQKESLKKFRLVRDLNPWPLRYRYSALPIKLTSQPGAGRWIGSWKTLERMMTKLWIYENHICALRSEELFEGRSSQLGRQLMQLRKESPARSMGSCPACTTCSQLACSSRSAEPRSL